MTMDMPLLPGWLEVLWALVLGAVAITHLWHVWWMSGRARWWHLAHVLMAAAMMVMYLAAQPAHADLYRAGVALFGALTISMILTCIWWASQDNFPNWLWAASTVGMLVMAYMSLPVGDHLATVTYLLVVYLAGEALVWVCNPLRLAADVTPAVRLSLAVMALGMGYMLVAMQTMHMHVVPAVMTMH
ncbi:DUF5134 domain-containing protein [Antricoccus suffuscus]|nr:DUF5134 domain-containing protein [Antricoccus suffuscus]